MTATQEAKALKAQDRADKKIIAVAQSMVPCKHLAIWAALRKDDPDIQPSEVWRVVINDPDFRYNPITSVFTHSKT